MIDVVIYADALAAIEMASLMKMRLGPAPLAAFMLGYIEPHVKSNVESAFEMEKSPDGTSWPELAPETVQRRLDEGYSAGPIQYRTGEFFDFMQSANSDITATQMGTSLSYPSQDNIDLGSGKINYKLGSAQYGNRRTGAPARPVLGLTLHDLEYISLGLVEYVSGVRLP